MSHNIFTPIFDGIDDKVGLSAFAPSPLTVTTTNAGTFYYVPGDVQVVEIQYFIPSSGVAAQYTYPETLVFELDWVISYSTDAPGVTITPALSLIRGGVSTIFEDEAMSGLAKTAGELYPLSGTLTPTLKRNDIIALVLTSDNSGTAVTLEKFSLTVRRFYR